MKLPDFGSQSTFIILIKFVQIWELLNPGKLFHFVAYFGFLVLTFAESVLQVDPLHRLLKRPNLFVFFGGTHFDFWSPLFCFSRG